MLSSRLVADDLSPFFDRFSLSVRVFYAGRLCGTSGDHETEQAGHLHVLRKGVLEVSQADGGTMVVNRPCFFIPGHIGTASKPRQQKAPKFFAVWSNSDLEFGIRSSSHCRNSW